MDARVIRAFTPVFDGLCPRMAQDERHVPRDNLPIVIASRRVRLRRPDDRLSEAIHADIVMAGLDPAIHVSLRNRKAAGSERTCAPTHDSLQNHLSIGRP
jgi:hypothetical protein